MRVFILIILTFVAGFLIRDYVGPVKLPFSLRTVRNIIKPETTKDFVPGNVEIVYDKGKFTPSEAVVPVGRYLTVINKSDSLMWLTSDNPGLTTPRGYGLSEQIKLRMDEPGTYHIKNKLNVEATMVIKVVP